MSEQVAAAYTRLSTDDTDQKSLPRQLHECRVAAEQHGYTIERVYEDNGFSGALWYRPALMQLVDAVRSGEIAAVFAADRDRLSRNPPDGWRLREEFRAHHVKLYIASQLIGDSAEEDFSSGMYDVFSSYERRKIIERSKRGKAQAARSGKVLVGPSVPLGYDVQSGQLVINPQEAALVERIYSLCVDRQIGTWRIAKLLSSERVATKTDRLPPSPNRNRKLQPPGVWSPSSIQRILRNTLYCGTWQYGRRESCEPLNPRTPPNLKRPKRSARLRDSQQWITVSVPRIIPDDLWQAAQTILDTNKYRNPRRRRHEYLFINHAAICGNCGRTLSGFMSRGQRFYRCASQSYNTITWCRGRIRADVLEQRIWDMIDAHLVSDPTYLKALLGQQADHTEQAVENLRRDQELYTQQLTTLDREAGQWERAYAGEAIGLERFKALMAHIDQRRGLTQERLQEIEALLSDQQSGQDQITYALQFLETLPHNPQDIIEKRRILEAIHLVVVVRNFQQIRLFFELPKHEHADGDEYVWRGPDTWQSIDWSEDATPTISISGTWSD